MNLNEIPNSYQTAKYTIFQRNDMATGGATKARVQPDLQCIDRAIRKQLVPSFGSFLVPFSIESVQSVQVFPEASDSVRDAILVEIFRAQVGHDNTK